MLTGNGCGDYIMNCLNLLYKSHPGRIFLKFLVMKPVSDLSGKILDSRFSKIFIGPFARRNNIKLSEYQLHDIRCFNDFFCRRIKSGVRFINRNKNNLIAPCDGLLSVYTISDGMILNIKRSRFTINELLRDRRLAGKYNGGYAFVFRLCVDNYHRYVYFDSGKKFKDRRIEGVYHTVRPVALEEYPVFSVNSREYSIIDSENFGRSVQMEVGAMLVGRIVNDHPLAGRVVRGREKGHFEYGGSTIIVLISQNKVCLRQDILKNVNKNKEIPVVMGEVIGRTVNSYRKIR